MQLQLIKIPWKWSLAEQKQSSQRIPPVLGMHEQLFCKPFARETEGISCSGGEECPVQDVHAPPAHASHSLHALGKELTSISRMFLLGDGTNWEKCLRSTVATEVKFFLALTSKTALGALKSQWYMWSWTLKWVYTLNFYLCEPAPNIPQWLHRQDTFINVSKPLKH